jgi:hypothetical protein
MLSLCVQWQLVSIGTVEIVLHKRQICRTKTHPAISDQDPYAYVGGACDAKPGCCRPWCASCRDYAKDAPVNARHAFAKGTIIGFAHLNWLWVRH